MCRLMDNGGAMGPVLKIRTPRAGIFRIKLPLKPPPQTGEYPISWITIPSVYLKHKAAKMSSDSPHYSIVLQV